MHPQKILFSCLSQCCETMRGVVCRHKEEQLHTVPVFAPAHALLYTRQLPSILHCCMHLDPTQELCNQGNLEGRRGGGPSPTCRIMDEWKIRTFLSRLLRTPRSCLSKKSTSMSSSRSTTAGCVSAAWESAVLTILSMYFTKGSLRRKVPFTLWTRATT